MLEIFKKILAVMLFIMIFVTCIKFNEITITILFALFLISFLVLLFGKKSKEKK